jgi:hypothetical protein
MNDRSTLPTGEDVREEVGNTNSNFLFLPRRPTPLEELTWDGVVEKEEDSESHLTL